MSVEADIVEVKSALAGLLADKWQSVAGGLATLRATVEAMAARLNDIEVDADRAMKLHDDFPDDLTGGGGVGSWPGKVYVLGITYSGLTNTAMPYVRVTLGAGGSVLVEETDEAFPSEMPPNEEWYIKAEETVPPRITRFG